MRLLYYPDPMLLTPCSFIPSASFPVNGELRQFIIDLRVFMKSLSWGKPAGLAANQVGNPIALFIDGHGEPFLNPFISDFKGQPFTVKEGCYSLEKNRYDYPVTRWPTIILEYNAPSGAYIRRRFSGLKAQAIQHEVDHCNGLLCCGKRS